MFSKLSGQGHQAFHMARTLTYLGEYKLLHQFTKLFRPWVEVPLPHHDPDLKPFLLNDIQQLFKEDSKLFIQGVAPWSLLTPESPVKHVKRLGKILVTSVQMSRLRKIRKTKPTETSAEVPDYFQRNFHWQVDGYLSPDSASIYDHQVEILFNGTAEAMRRMALAPMHDFLKSFEGTARVLEFAAGTGAASEGVLKSFPKHDFTITDVSGPYLDQAMKRLQGYQASFLRTPAESTPFQDQTFNVIFSVFLFHEIPTEIRARVMEEAMRLLKPGGLFIIIDSIQSGEVPEYEWALEKFPLDYHEPFYHSYINWPLEKAFAEHGFKDVQSTRGFFSKCAWGIKPSP